MAKTAGLELRVSANVVDCLILGFPCFLVINGEYYIRFQYFPNAVCIALGVLYSVGFLASAWQATPGMRLLGIYIVRAEDSGRLGYIRAVARYLVYNAVFLLFIAVPSLDPRLPVNFVGEKGERYAALYQKDQLHEPLAPKERQFLDKAYSRVGLGRSLALPSLFVACVYTLIAIVPIGFTKQNVGLHDILCRTRVLCGFPAITGG